MERRGEVTRFAWTGSVCIARCARRGLRPFPGDAPAVEPHLGPLRRTGLAPRLALPSVLGVLRSPQRPRIPPARMVVGTTAAGPGSTATEVNGALGL